MRQREYSTIRSSHGMDVGTAGVRFDRAQEKTCVATADNTTEI